MKFTCPPLPQDNSDLKQVAAKKTAQDLAVNSGAFISTPGTPSTVHVIAPCITIIGVNLL